MLTKLIISSSIGLSIIFNLFFKNYFYKKNLIDKIKDRSSHTVLALRSGGAAIASSLILISVTCYLLNIELYEYSLLVPILLLFIVGLYDDVYDVDFKLKFLFQVITAKIIIDSGLIIDNFHGIFGLYDIPSIFAQIISILVIVSIINSFNFIDGIDGLASTIFIIFIISFEFFSSFNSDFLYLSMMLVLMLIPVIYFNFSKSKKVFLGDSGSLLLGVVISIYILYSLSSNYIIKDEFDVNKILFIISIFSYPIIDFTRVIFIRVLNKKSPFIADNNHIHHAILKQFKSHGKVTLVIALSSILLMCLIQLLF
jgi:UDP-GlcNAc:undecaprenyl-phosphate/decaprenyl-phosphate GlcNAc-1-phosphate transferase